MLCLFKSLLLLGLIFSIYFKVASSIDDQSEVGVNKRKSIIRRSIALATTDKKPYKTINNYLEENVQSDDVETNLEKALEWLSSNMSKKKTPLSNNKPLIEALKQFTSLSLLQGSNKCNGVSYRILTANDRVLKGLDDEKKSPLKRVEYIVYKCASDHAKACQHVYPTVYKTIYSQMDEDLVYRAEIFVDRIINWELANSLDYFYDENLRLYDKFVKESYKSDHLNLMDHAKIAYSTIGDLAHDDSDWKYLQPSGQKLTKKLRIEKVKSLFKKYLVEPCQYYAKELGPNVFIPARYDAMSYQSEKNLDQAWARFGICESVINPLDEQKLLMKKVLLLSL